MSKIDSINDILKNGKYNEIFNIFYKTLGEIVDRHASLTRVTKKERTSQLIKTMDKEPLIHEEIKKMRNNVTF